MPLNAELDPALSLVHAAADDFSRRFPTDGGRRQPVHVVYGGMHLFTAQTPSKFGHIARGMLDAYAPDGDSLSEVFGLHEAIADLVHARVVEKLSREPVEDFRLDAEDGYGHRTDAEEDAHVDAAAAQVAEALKLGTAPPFLGLRIKALTPAIAPRALRTLDRFFSALGPRTPSGFLVTLPKVTDARQVSALAQVLGALEARAGIEAGAVKLEVMIESAPGLYDAHGRLTLPSFIEAAQGRLFAAHFGAFDYTASMEIAAPMQRLDHPACDHVRQLMKLAFSGTGVFVSDGATTRLPIAEHKGTQLTEAQRHENHHTVHAAWRESFDSIGHALDQGFFQGWDLHPGQLIPRYVTTFAFFLSQREAMTRRLSTFIEGLGRATLSGDRFDDAATGQGLLNFFLRGWSCGALTDADLALTESRLRP